MAGLNWDQIEKDYQEFIQKLSDSSLVQQERAGLQKKASQYSELLSSHKNISKLKTEIQDLKQSIQDEKDEEMQDLYKDEIEEKEKTLKALEFDLDDLLYPTDERNKRSVFLEIRAGAGGQEAALFVGDLFKMYGCYAEPKRWAVSIIDYNSTDIGGYKELIIHIKGKNVFNFLKFESGVHRVQRVPETETAGRIHTSTVTVAVLPEANEVDASINPQDLRIDTYRASGAGGQHVNTTDSAVRITHIPTGVVVSCQDERSQIKNRAKAMKVLASRLIEADRLKKEAEMSASRKQQVGMGQRSEKIRTYNFPQNRVTDHRINLTLKKLDLVMQGDLDDLIVPLLEWESEERRKQGSLFLEEK